MDLRENILNSGENAFCVNVQAIVNVFAPLSIVNVVTIMDTAL